MTNFNDFLNERLKDADFKKEYEMFKLITSDVYRNNSEHIL